MNSIFSVQFGEFSQASPNWFDWFSLIISVVINAISILFAYYLGEKVYKREKRDKTQENTEIQLSEIELFKNNISQLKIAIDKQIIDLKEYIEKKDFILTFHPDIQVDFLQFIDIKYLYKNVGVGNSEAIEEINKFMTNLYTLYDFRQSLRDEVRTYNKKYNFHESKFYLYRQLLYTKYYSICNVRAESFIIENGIKKWKFKADDNFMAEYSTLIKNTFADNSIIDNNGLKDRKKLNDNFILPLAIEANKYIPEDSNAIEINDIANQVNSAFIDMESVTEKHFRTIDSYLTNLEMISEKIANYLV
jgi:hypothetical protein